MKTLKLALAASVLAAIFSLAACGSDAPANQSANAPNVNANVAAKTTPAAPAATPDALASARADFKQFCIRCHKEDGTGGVAELDEGQKIKVPNFREGHGAKHTVEQMAKKITNGDTDEGMPAFGKRLPPERIEALARFISQEFHGQPADAPANVAPAAAKSPAPGH
ncbi:MAG TPA: cytochrome c [Pyrinomonadaceae bacterium]|jgi:mono/diheme cytochrome c family protein|nr:cytochrome c [Pyrinomonadaceae bacterium]